MPSVPPDVLVAARAASLARIQSAIETLRHRAHAAATLGPSDDTETDAYHPGARGGDDGYTRRPAAAAAAPAQPPKPKSRYAPRT